MSRGRDGDLEVLEERVLIAIPRGEEELRVTFTRAATSRGDTAWHGIRVWYRGTDGAMHPSKSGVTIRGKELHQVAVAFLRASASSVPAELHAAAKAIVEALSSKTPAPSPRPARWSRGGRSVHSQAPFEPVPPIDPDPPDLF